MRIGLDFTYNSMKIKAFYQKHRVVNFVRKKVLYSLRSHHNFNLTRGSGLRVSHSHSTLLVTLNYSQLKELKHLKLFIRTEFIK